jgi:hypothetical protein
MEVKSLKKCLKEKDYNLAQVQEKQRITENELNATKMLMRELKEKKRAQNRPKDLFSITDDGEKSEICNDEDPDKKLSLKWFDGVSMTNET